MTDASLASRLLPDCIALTKAGLPRLRCPAGRAEQFFWDSELSGFGLRALASGKRRWVVQYRDAHNRTRRMVLGDAAAVDPAQARALAKTALAKVAAGENPSVERQSQRKLLKCDALFEAYLRHAQDAQRPSTYDNTARNLNKYAASLHREPIEAIDRGRLYELHQRLGREIGKVAANRVLSTLGACWAWALKTGCRFPLRFDPGFPLRTDPG